ncbi:CobW family GTP-binding protein [Halovenus sp. HT40]|uniref:CobW family GTP-binding protein n=1 Tax=Halovenus sp. HT40 TaxID=3126691 RepID=UPI00300F4967
MSTTQLEQVPVTVISGPLGAGKTTLVNRLLSNPGDRRLAVIVNDMGEVNIDAELIESEADDEGIVDLSNGCICCRLQGDLLDQARRLATDREFDHLVVEASGISEPLPIAQTLTRGVDEDADPPEAYRLDAVVSVIDAYGFWKAFDPEESLPEAAPDPERPLTDVLVDQIEFCNVLLLNKCDMVPDDALDEIEATIRELQPEADLYRTTYSDIDPGLVLGTGQFDLAAAKRTPGWKQALAGDGHDGHDHSESAAERHGVESTIYRASRPFDPVSFADWLDEWEGNVVRAKGFTWVTSRPEEVLGVSQAGPSVQAGPIGEWGEDEPLTKLVFIGRDLDTDRLRTELDECLAPEGWDAETALSSREDPFPREN